MISTCTFRGKKIIGFLFLQHALRSYSLVFDAVYTPKLTRLLREAEESGATIVSGLEMFIGQAYEQFERFTGLPGNMIVNSLITFIQTVFFITLYLIGN